MSSSPSPSVSHLKGNHSCTGHYILVKPYFSERTALCFLFAFRLYLISTSEASEAQSRALRVAAQLIVHRLLPVSISVSFVFLWLFVCYIPHAPLLSPLHQLQNPRKNPLRLQAQTLSSFVHYYRLVMVESDASCPGIISNPDLVGIGVSSAFEATLPYFRI